MPFYFLYIEVITIVIALDFSLCFVPRALFTYIFNYSIFFLTTMFSIYLCVCLGAIFVEFFLDFGVVELVVFEWG